MRGQDLACAARSAASGGCEGLGFRLSGSPS
jgi:hypothetical protein